MVKNSTKEYNTEQMNIHKDVIVRLNDLPLRCPMSDDAVWCSHPRVSLAIEKTEHKEISCPYCGTKYRLESP